MAIQGYYRFPAIWGDRLVFTSEDDLWLVGSTGGIPRRLTAGLGAVSLPCFSPDGAWIAFSGRDEGPTEAWVMPADGGPAERLSFFGTVCRVIGWRDNEHLLVTSNAEQAFPQQHMAYLLPRRGGAPIPLDLGPVFSLSDGPGGAMVIGRNAIDPARWKRYRGGTAGDLLIDRLGKGKFQKLLQLNGNLAYPMWIGNRIYFLSDHEGTGNLYSCTPTGKNITRHTHHEDFYVRYPNTDGTSIVYHAGADLFVLHCPTNTVRQVAITYPGPRPQRNRRFVPAANNLETCVLHPQNHLLCITARGKLFTTGNWNGPINQHGKEDGVRYRCALWLNDGKRILALSDEGGEEHLVLFHQDGSRPPHVFQQLDIGSVETMALSPTADMLALSNHRCELLLVDLKKEHAIHLDGSEYGPLTGLAWSPDGCWLAYSSPISRHTRIIKVADSKKRTTYAITRPVLEDVSPTFSPDGKYLYFISYRQFDPVYDDLHFALGFPRGSRPYVIPLTRDVPSPFFPQPQPTPATPPVPAPQTPQTGMASGYTTPATAVPPELSAQMTAGYHQTETLFDLDHDLDHDLDCDNFPASGCQLSDWAKNPVPPSATGAKNAGKTTSGAAVKVKIDFDGITERILSFPVPDGRYAQIAALKNKVLFTSFPVEGALQRVRGVPETPPKGVLEAFDFEQQKTEVLVSGISSFSLSRDRTMLMYAAGKKIRLIKAGEKADENLAKEAPGKRSGWLDLARIHVSVTPSAEWSQMFREAWRLQRDRFWTPDMSGIDWENVYQRYFPLVERVSTRGELSDLIWEMQGELGTSHAYEIGGDYRVAPNYAVGSLGCDLVWQKNRKLWQITRIVHGDPWNPEATSPLSRPGLNVEAGATLLAIGGRPIPPGCHPNSMLVHRSNSEIMLTIGDEAGKKPRQIVVKTLATDVPARYRDWVENNRAYVHQKTQGRIGYIHIPDMGARGFSEFHRYFLSEIDRDGLLVDVRFNGGGHVSQLLLEKLARKRIAYTQTRWFGVTTYPSESVGGPIVALTNENAGSDGDIFSHCFKLLKLGPLVGKRTWGGVIGISPRRAFVDGGYVTQPEYSFWFQDVGYRVENFGTMPDIEVDNLPQDYAARRDPQLDRGITEALRLLRQTPPRIPQLKADRPRLAPPKLPAKPS